MVEKMEPFTHLICWTTSRLAAADAPVRDCLVVRPTLLPTRCKAQGVPRAGGTGEIFGESVQVVEALEFGVQSGGR